MLKSFNIMIKKEAGAERINTDITTILEQEGWKVERLSSREFIVATSTRKSAYYKDEASLISRLRKILTPLQLKRCVLVKFGEDKGSGGSSLGSDGHGT